MSDIIALLDYFKKLRRAIDNADFRLFKYRLVKKSRIDDLLVCTLAVLPDSYKKAMKKRLKIDLYPSVSCYNRMSKIIKKPFFLAPDYYIVNYHDVIMMLQAISKHLESDIKKIENEQV